MTAELEGRDAQQRDASESSSRRRRRARRELSPQQLRDRRERRKGWIVPFGGLFGVVGAYVGVVLVTGAGTYTVEPPTPDEVSAEGTTQFGEAGLAYVQQWHIVHVNLEHGPLTADDVGLDDDAHAVAEAPPGQIWAMVVGMDQGGLAGDGAIRLVVDSVSVTTEAGLVTSIDVARPPYVWASYPTVMNDLQDGVEAFGWEFDPAVRAEIDDIVGDAVRAGQPVTVAVEPGMVTGVEVGAEVVCRDDGHCGITYQLDPSQTATTT